MTHSEREAHIKKSGGTVADSADGSFIVDMKPDYKMSLVFEDPRTGFAIFLTSQDVPRGFVEAEDSFSKMLGEKERDSGALYADYEERRKMAKPEGPPLPVLPRERGPSRFQRITRILNVAAGMSPYGLPRGVERTDIELLDTPEERILDPPATSAHAGHLPPSSPLGQIVAKLREWHREGRIILVHCNAGVSRSAAAVLGYLMVDHGFDYETAYSLVKDKRHSIRPNEGFVKQLKELDGRLKGAHQPHFKSRESDGKQQ